MGYEKVTDLSTDTVVKIGGLNSKTGKANPTKMEGYYLGSRTVKSENGDSTIHTFQTPKGNEGIWGTADINSKLGQVRPGTMVLVQYKEKRKLAGGKTKYVYDVMFDVENTIPVFAALNNPPVGNEDGDTGYSTGDEGSDYTTGAEEDESQDEQLQALEAARRQAQAEKVKALLNKNKKA